MDGSPLEKFLLYFTRSGAKQRNANSEHSRVQFAHALHFTGEFMSDVEGIPGYSKEEVIHQVELNLWET
jgi:hypothetical protein